MDGDLYNEEELKEGGYHEDTGGEDVALSDDSDADSADDSDIDLVDQESGGFELNGRPRNELAEEDGAYEEIDQYLAEANENWTER